MPDPSTMPIRRRRSRLKIALGVLALLVVLFIVLLPTLVSLGLGQGLVRSAIASNLNGEVAFSSLRAGWFGSQKIDGLRITDAAGKEAANLSITVNNSLLALALGRARPTNVSVSGSAHGQVREDGSISFADLVKQKPPSRVSQPSTR